MTPYTDLPVSPLNFLPIGFPEQKADGTFPVHFCGGDGGGVGVWVPAKSIVPVGPLTLPTALPWEAGSRMRGKHFPLRLAPALCTDVEREENFPLPN